MIRLKDKRKNKRGDIAVTVLVLGVLALLIFGLLSFYLSEKRIKSGGIRSFSHLQKLYNDADSAQFSGELVPKYGVLREDGKFVLRRDISEDFGGFLGIGSEKIEVLRISYKFG